MQYKYLPPPTETKTKLQRLRYSKLLSSIVFSKSIPFGEAFSDGIIQDQ